ncbi:uncharacterized protein BO97DRAFT_480908 [Aspergillus homomorphus CBS 101889]|uniref:Uncharacterized protein n=1 Tax=Aspergillus homomorphus (strain CBS 101889) TaxID=1450537 RepID=A0A395HJ66_ASPHC|nr:hypothetical protein BO97DRAFT_480908 [Aspergillus homomorphus CBS 101889]RAL07961.1 hypothetical protein BO97DRAFT_480908 [Aspergillus homomorphus CBS 101889]
MNLIAVSIIFLLGYAAVGTEISRHVRDAASSVTEHACGIVQSSMEYTQLTISFATNGTEVKSSWSTELTTDCVTFLNSALEPCQGPSALYCESLNLIFDQSSSGVTGTTYSVQSLLSSAGDHKTSFSFEHSQAPRSTDAISSTGRWPQPIFPKTSVAEGTKPVSVESIQHSLSEARSTNDAQSLPTQWSEKNSQWSETTSQLINTETTQVIPSNRQVTTRALSTANPSSSSALSTLCVVNDCFCQSFFRVSSKITEMSTPDQTKETLLEKPDSRALPTKETCGSSHTKFKDKVETSSSNTLDGGKSQNYNHAEIQKWLRHKSFYDRGRGYEFEDLTDLAEFNPTGITDSNLPKSRKRAYSSSSTAISEAPTILISEEIPGNSVNGERDIVLRASNDNARSGKEISLPIRNLSVRTKDDLKPQKRSKIEDVCALY